MNKKKVAVVKKEENIEIVIFLYLKLFFYISLFKKIIFFIDFYLKNMIKNFKN